MRSAGVTLLVVLVGLGAGCFSVKSYVDPMLPKVGYADLLPRREPRPAVLTVAFHRNGEPLSGGLSRTRDEIRSTLERSKLFTSVTDTATGDADRFDVVLDNRADTGDAVSKGC